MTTQVSPDPSSSAAAWESAFSEAITLHKTGDVAAAAQRYERLSEVYPDHSHLLYLLGAAQLQLGQTALAIPRLEKSLALRPNQIPALEAISTALVKSRDNAKAVGYLEQLVSAKPEDVQRWLELGAASDAIGQNARAAAAYLRAIALDPTRRRAYTAAARSFSLAGLNEEAEAILRQGMAAHPRYIRVYTALATHLLAMQRDPEAEQICRAGLAFAPGDADAWQLLAVCFQRNGYIGDSAEAYRHAVEAKADEPRILIPFGDMLTETGQLDEAEAVLTRALADSSLAAAALTGLGRVKEKRGLLAEAIALHDQAVKADPTHKNAWLNRGNAKRFAGDVAGALADYDETLKMGGSIAGTANRGVTLLTLGRLAEGWPEYGARLKAIPGAIDLAGDRPWAGESLAGKRVLVWTEAGLGDEVMFMSFMPEVLACAAHCTVVCSPRLLTVFRRSFPQADYIPAGTAVTGDYDIRVALVDLARKLRPDLNSFPAHAGYLRAEPGLTALLRDRYKKNRDRVLVGISWRSESIGTGRFKSIDLSQWENILRTPDVTFVSLQYGDPAADVTAARAATGAEIIVDDEITTARSLDAFASQVAAMDLIISISNTTVHLAGALGRPTWVFVPKGQGAHWYWFADRVDSPWYPSMRLYRQDTPSIWRDTLHEVENDLARFRPSAEPPRT